jgi:hypothetical protein
MGALKDGLAVWDDVMSTVKVLNSDVMTHAQNHDPQVVLDLIRKATEKLKERLEIANNSNWKPLQVAIGHEISAMEQAYELMAAAEAK